MTTPPDTLTPALRLALAWAHATAHHHVLPCRQPSLATLGRLRDRKLITFTHHVACRMRIVRDVVLTPAGERAHEESPC